MAQSHQKILRFWLYTVCIFIGALVLIGGYTRLTRSGLSIVEWNVITGVLPPIGQEAWEAEFAKYQASPEGQLINPNMTLEGYERIYYVEYFHRLIGRVTGLIYVLPLFYFLARGIIPWRKSVPYLAVGLGFAFQGVLGWYMVASGLENMPQVSHYRLAAHLIAALSLLALTFWVALDQYGFDLLKDAEFRSKHEKIESALLGLRLPAGGLIVVLLLQVTYGAFVAGLKAGHVSNTWPFMMGQLIPTALFATVEPWWINLFSSELTVHFIHRWFAFVVLGISGWLYHRARKTGSPLAILNSTLIIFWITVIQITLGVLVVLFNVTISLAIIHQGSAMILLLAIVHLNYKVFTVPVPKVQTEQVARPSLTR